MRRIQWSGIVFGVVFGVVFGLSLSAQAKPITEDYSEVQSQLKALAAKYADHVKLFDLGISDSGLPIQGVAIGNGSVKNLVVATHHGNEYGSTEVALGFAESLAASPLAGQTLYVIPVLNISGYNARTRQEKTTKGSYDPNRDYPGPCGTAGPFHLKSTKALADFVAANDIVASATLHTFYPAVVYPWGISTLDLLTPYNDFFKSLVQAATIESHYQTGNSTEVLYPADGTFEDYAFWKHGIWSLLFELGTSHTPSQGAVDEAVRVNLPGLRRMMAQAPTQRAENHDFTGKCDTRLRILDRHDE